ncbi:efflux RND transporter periplasmic adaptor subunit [Methylobacterium iners]|uniref:Macrolide export protein MacA n=1 Tax=Methylobacterium iners TaxID=418707 RepID=A0ABQ4RS51_9HYPH|nr:efflux RND transporter periplasmic adaptor subunit [Methylobacterium iners]GJD93605.1 Macrolide export protein MacA [Methylobacterium iners]
MNRSFGSRPIAGGVLATILALSAAAVFSPDGTANVAEAQEVTGSLDPAAGPRPGGRVADAPLTVTSAFAQRDVVPTVVTASGSLVARREVPVGFEIGGFKVAAVLADVDDRVTAGQVLLRFDTDLLSLQLAQNEAGAAKAGAAVAQAEAAVPEAEANLRVALGDYERAESLRGSNAISTQVFDQRRGAVDQARARLASAKAAVTVAKAELAYAEAVKAETRARIEKAVVRAPVAGVISRRNAEPGAVIQQWATEPLFRIIADGEVEMAAEVPDLDLAEVRPGQAAHVVLADGRLVEGRVRLVSPLVEGRTRMGTVYVSLKADFGLRPGAYARADITTDQVDAVTMPMSAIEVRDGLATTLVVGRDGRAERRKLKLGRSAEGRVAVLDGLASGEQVVSSAAGFVREGARVRTAVADPRD